MNFRKLALAGLIALLTTTVVNAAPNRPTNTPPSRGNSGSPPNTPPNNGGRGGMKAPPTGGVVGKVPNQTPNFRPGMPARPAIAGPARLYPYQPGIIVKPQIIPYKR